MQLRLFLVFLSARGSKKGDGLGGAPGAFAIFQGTGSRSITITGGGEPTLYPRFDEFPEFVDVLGYDLGLVTNGLRWGKREGELPANHHLTWVRMSIGIRKPENMTHPG